MIRSKDLVVTALTRYAQSNGELRKLLKTLSKNANSIDNTSRAPTADGKVKKSSSRYGCICIILIYMYYCIIFMRIYNLFCVFF